MLIFKKEIVTKERELLRVLLLFERGQACPTTPNLLRPAKSVFESSEWYNEIENSLK